VLYEVSEKFNVLLEEKLSQLHGSPIHISVSKSGRLRWAARHVHSIFMGNILQSRHLEGQ
jgi:hypothetical protein